MKVILAQHNPVIGDLQGNTQKVLDSLDHARKVGADLVVFPELTLCGYVPDDLVLYDAFIKEMEESLDRIVRYSKGVAAIVGLARKNPRQGDKGLLNSAAVMQDGLLMGFYDKWLLPTYDVFNERRYFARGDQVRIFEIKGQRVAVTICEDIWQNAGQDISGVNYPWDPVREYEPFRPDLMCNLSASPYQFGKPDVRVQVCKAVADRLSAPIIYCCQVGANGALIFDGGSLVLDKHGQMLAQAPFFEECDLCLDLINPSPFTQVKIDPLEMLKDALVLGIKDYFAKSQMDRAIVGVSGGIDSAVVAVLAAEALGKEHVTAVFCPSSQTPAHSAADVRTLCSHLGISLVEIPVDQSLIGIKQLFERYVGYPLSEHHSHNMESRLRALLLMGLANQKGALLLNSNNKTEYAVGVCTLYGDMCGTISPIGDLLKGQVYELAHFLNKGQPSIPDTIFEKIPSIEFDYRGGCSEDVMCCDIIDMVVKSYVEEYLTAEEIASKTKLTIDQVRNVVARIYRAEHKRRQSAPSLRVSGKAFGAGRHKPLHSRWFGDSY